MRRTRKDRRLSQAKLAEMAGLSTNTIRVIEQAGSYYKTSMEDVAAALGWPDGAVDRYLRGDDSAIPRSVPTDAKTRILSATAAELVAMRASIARSRGEEAGDEWLVGALRMREEGEGATRSAG